MLWERRASAREATRSPGHQRHASSRGRNRALSWEKAVPRQRTPRARDAQEDGQPWHCVPPDTTLPAGQGRTFTTPTTPHPQQEGPLRGRGPPRESSRARAATEMRERKGSPGQPRPGSNREEGEEGQPGAAMACAFFCGVLLCSHHLQKLRDQRTEDQEAGRGVHSLSLGTAQPRLPPLLPTPRRGRALRKLTWRTTLPQALRVPCPSRLPHGPRDHMRPGLGATL